MCVSTCAAWPLRSEVDGKTELSLRTERDGPVLESLGYQEPTVLLNPGGREGKQRTEPKR